MRRPSLELEKLHTAAALGDPVIELLLARLETREETSDKTELLRKAIARVFEENLDDRNQSTRRARECARARFLRS